MPLIIEHIDAIARAKKRGVLFVEFRRPEDENDGFRLGNLAQSWQTLPERQQVIDWLDAHGVAWSRCSHFANVSLMMGYRGQIYIDLPFDTDLPAFQALDAFLVNPDGSMRLPNTVFIYLPLELAMKNAHHDEPGFWDQWAASF